MGRNGSSFVRLGVSMAPGVEECTQPGNPIETDRPDTTNSAIVVPADIFFDGTNNRWRLGIASCLEVLADVPNYTAT